MTRAGAMMVGLWLALLVTALGLLEHWGRRAPALPPQS